MILVILLSLEKIKVDLFAPANVATESTWQQSIVDIQNATYGQLRKDAEISAIKQKQKIWGGLL